MISKPVIFISSTSDLRSARDLVGRVLYSMGYEPVWQDIAATDGGELLAVLRDRIHPCQMMIQLVGNRYGAEPPYPSPEFGRVSYTQFEAMYAERLGKKVVYHFLTGDFPTDVINPEPQELIDLQSAYRQRIIAINKLHQDNISSPQDLELSIRRIQDELASVRKLSDFRFRRLIWLVGGSLAGLAAIAILTVGGFYLLHSRQREQIIKIDQQTVRSVDQSGQLERIEKLLSTQKQANPQAVPILSATDQAILDEAKKQGDLKTRAAASVLQPDAQTDALLDQLRAQQTAQQFDLAMLEGKRWNYDKLPQYDKAVPFFEDAIKLRPDSIDARNYAAEAHTFARLGDIAAHQRRAIEICEGTLKIVAPGTPSWALAQHALGNAWNQLPTGDKGENVEEAIAAYQAALTVRTREADPKGWAGTEDNLGCAWRDRPNGNQGENLRMAIGLFASALTVFTKQADPSDWASTQNNLGTAWHKMPNDDTGENQLKAISAYEAALTVYTRKAQPIDWAMTQNNLSNSWADMPSGDKGENLHKAIEGYDAALTVYDRKSDPARWAGIEFNLGLAWRAMHTGDKGENLSKAINAYEASLTVYTKKDDPSAWALAQINLGMTWYSMPIGSKGDNLRRAISAMKAVSAVWTEKAYPDKHAILSGALNSMRWDYYSLPEATTQPFYSIPAAE